MKKNAEYYGLTNFSKDLLLHPYSLIEKLKVSIDEREKDRLYCMAHLANTYAYIGDYEEAEKWLKVLKHEIKNANFIYHTTKEIYATVRLKIFIFKKQYKYAFNYFKENEEYIVNKDGRGKSPLYFIAKQLDIELEPDEYKNYLKGQIYNYTLEKTIKHIDDSHGELVLDIRKKSIFSNNIDINKLVEIVSPLLQNAKKYHQEAIVQTSYYKLDSCGVLEGETCDYICVVSFIHSNDIITIFPCQNPVELQTININSIYYGEPEQTKPKLLRLSQKQKFEIKYKKFNEK